MDEAPPSKQAVIAGLLGISVVILGMLIAFLALFVAGSTFR